MPSIPVQRAAILALAGLAAAVLAASGSAAAAGPPRRIVSLNLCTDQLLVDLVPLERIAAVSILGPDPRMSAAADRLAGLRTVAIEAEQVLALDPDLIVTGEWAPPAVHLIRRLGRRVEQVPLANDVPGLEAAIRQLAAAVGDPKRGEAVIARLAEDLARSAPARTEGGLAPTATALQVNSLVSGPGTLIDTLLAAAGLRNAMAGRTLGPGGRLPLEALVADPPDAVVLSNAAGDFLTVAADNLRHPALAALLARRPSVHIPMRWWLCATPRLPEAVARLAAVRDAVAAARGAR